jgi:hypothetical protein
MTNPAHERDAVVEWLGVPETIERAIAGLAEHELDRRGGDDGWSIREYVHHVIESNFVASNILLAALAASGCVYDWSWVYPNKAWVERLGYAKAPLAPALQALRSLSQHMAGLVRGQPDGLAREVKLLDAPGATPYARSVEAVLRQEVEHAREHLATVAEIRAALSK